MPARNSELKNNIPRLRVSGSAIPDSENHCTINHETLGRIPLLSDLNEEEKLRVLGELRIQRVARRDVIIQREGDGNSLLFLLSGQLQVVNVTEDGRAVGLRLLGPGDFFGEIAVISNCPRTASVVALNTSVVAFLPRATALHLFSHSPSVANKILRHLAEKIRMDSEFRAVLSIHNTSRRVYALLEILKQTKPGGVEVVENFPTHQDIAIMLNTSRETVTRALLALTQKGVVQKDMNRLIIRNVELLQKLVRGASK